MARKKESSMRRSVSLDNLLVPLPTLTLEGLVSLKVKDIYHNNIHVVDDLFLKV